VATTQRLLCVLYVCHWSCMLLTRCGREQQGCLLAAVRGAGWSPFAWNPHHALSACCLLTHQNASMQQPLTCSAPYLSRRCLLAPSQTCKPHPPLVCTTQPDAEMCVYVCVVPLLLTRAAFLAFAMKLLLLVPRTTSPAQLQVRLLCIPHTLLLRAPAAPPIKAREERESPRAGSQSASTKGPGGCSRQAWSASRVRPVCLPALPAALTLLPAALTLLPAALTLLPAALTLLPLACRCCQLP